MTGGADSLRVTMVVGNIPGLNTGKGGHYYSAKEIASELSRHSTVNVLVLGRAVPEPLRELPRLAWIECGQMPTPRTLRHIRQVLSETSPHVIHCMDSGSLLFMRLANLSCQIPICWTKCGGRPLQRYTPRGAPDIVFHREDLELYQRRGFKPLMIPNRFRIPRMAETAPRREASQPLRLIRISRICEKYREGLEKTINFHRALLDQFPDATLDVIGFPEDPAVLDRLRILAPPSVRFLTRDEMTREASRHLPGYTIAIASGRAAMEAISYGLPTLTTPTASPAPVLVRSSSFDALLAANFSERAVLRETMEGAVEQVQALISSAGALKMYRQWTELVYREHISIESAVGRYLTLYRRLIQEGFKESTYDLMKHLAMLQTTLLLRRLREAQSGDRS